MYRTIHRIEQIVNGVREVIEPNSVIDSIDNAEALVAAGAIAVFQAPEVTITTKEKPSRKRKAEVETAEAAEADEGSEFG